MIIGGGIFSLREIMHTLSANSAQERSRNSVLHLSDPGPWDALICSSTAGKKIVKGSLEDQDNDLRWHHGATRLERPQLPVSYFTGSFPSSQTSMENSKSQR